MCRFAPAFARSRSASIRRPYSMALSGCRTQQSLSHIFSTYVFYTTIIMTKAQIEREDGQAPKRAREMQNKEVYITLFVVSLLLLAISILLESLSRLKLLSHLVGELGIAGVTSTIIIFTFERLSSEEFRKLAEEERTEIQKHVIEHVFKRLVPREIVDETIDLVLRANFIRQNLNATYHFYTIDDEKYNKSYVKIVFVLNYIVKNVTHNDQFFKLNTGIDLIAAPSLSEQCKFLSVRVVGEDTLINIGENDINSYCTPTPRRLKLENKDAIKVRAEKSIEVTISAQMIKHLDGDIDYFLFNHHTWGVKILADVHDVPELEVHAGDYLEGRLRTTSAHAPERNLYEWEMSQPLLTNQSIVISWGLNRKRTNLKDSE